MSFYVEVELSNPDAETRTEAIGPFASRDTAATFAASLGKAAGLMQPNPDVAGYWYGAGEYESANGYHQDTSVTVMVRPHRDKRVRPTARLIKDFLRGED